LERRKSSANLKKRLKPGRYSEKIIKTQVEHWKRQLKNEKMTNQVLKPYHDHRKVPIGK